MKELLCNAFCSGLTVTEISVGFAVGSPFLRGADRLAIFFVRKPFHSDYFRLEDDGLTIAYLTEQGVDPFDGARAVALSHLMQDFGVLYDEQEVLFHTEYMSISDAAQYAFRFLSFLLRIQDFRMLTREKVEETFKADVIAALRERFEGRALIDEAEPAIADLRDYVADVVIRPADRSPLAVYIGNSETKALEALVFGQIVEMQHLSCKTALIVQSERPRRIKGRTLSRATASLPVVVFPGRVAEALDYIERSVFDLTGYSGRTDQSI
jgi:hypothetical protein